MWWVGKLNLGIVRRCVVFGITKYIFFVFHFQAPIVNLLSSRQKDLRRDAAGALGNVAMSPPLIAKSELHGGKLLPRRRADCRNMEYGIWNMS